MGKVAKSLAVNPCQHGVRAAHKYEQHVHSGRYVIKVRAGVGRAGLGSRAGRAGWLLCRGGNPLIGSSLCFDHYSVTLSIINRAVVLGAHHAGGVGCMKTCLPDVMPS